MTRVLFTVLAGCVPAVCCLAADPTYTELREAKPDGRVVALEDFRFERDALKFTLSGRLHLLREVAGRTPGAVFLGQGAYELTPATDLERDRLKRYADDAELTTLSDRFDAAVFYGGALLDAVTAAGLAPGAPAGAGDPAAVSALQSFVKDEREELFNNLMIRELQELLDGGEPFFFAWIDGARHPPAALIVDPLGAEAIRITGRLGNEKTMMWVTDDTKGGAWYLSHLKAELDEGQARVTPPVADAEHYRIDVSIDGSEIKGRTEVTLTPSRDVRVVPLQLFDRLSISAAELKTPGDSPEWRPLEHIQEKDDEDAAVVAAEPLKAGQRYLLRFTYAGKGVLENAGDGNYTVGRRGDWYPNVGIFDDLATYELRFRVNPKMQVVGVGREVENRVEGDERVVVWEAAEPIRVAGFNYGTFRQIVQEDEAAGVTFEVYTNPGTPDIIEEINRGRGELSGPRVKVDVDGLARAAMADGINTVRTANVYFGPLPQNRLAITQQTQWFFGQSWPTLVYLPYIAFLTSMSRNTLGLRDTQDFVDLVGPHEVAHQWWGHHVGYRSYHDEWLSEGFAEFTAALVALQTGGMKEYQDFFERARKRILEKPLIARVSNDAAGPIWMGFRVATRQNPVAASPIVYSKGAYVLHMLRMAMWDRQRGDEDFIAMMKEYATTWAGKEPGTGDFQRIAEKHVTPNLRVTSDGKLDWFFNQWVYGTAIPKYTSRVESRDLGGGKYKISGSLTQSDVPNGFAARVPLYVRFPKSDFIRLMTVLMVGNTTETIDFDVPLPEMPRELKFNALHDILER